MNPVATCGGCGKATEEPPPTWTAQVMRQRTRQWLCERCTRDRLPAIESRLDEPWW
jgi:hypothetical protein